MAALRRVLALLALCAANALPGSVRVVGSDLLAGVLVPALAEWSRHEERPLRLAFAGSHDGWRELQAGRADLAIISFPPGETPPAAPFVTLPFAWHLAVVLVPEKLPLTQVALPKLAGVLGVAASGGWKRWADLGVTGAMAGRNILPQVWQPAGSLGPELLRQQVLQGRPWRPDMPIITTTDRGADKGTAATDRMIVAPLPWPASTGFKALALARDAEAAAFAPTAHHVQRGDYPLAWPVQLVFRRDHIRELYPLLRHLLGDEVARLCPEMHLLPAPETVRTDAVFGLEHL